MKSIIRKCPRSQVHKQENKLNRSCDQIEVLCGRVNDLRRRYKRAQTHGNKSVMRSLKMQLLVYQGVWSAYRHCASQQAAALMLLEHKMAASHVGGYSSPARMEE